MRFPLSTGLHSVLIGSLDRRHSGLRWRVASRSSRRHPDPFAHPAPPGKPLDVGTCNAAVPLLPQAGDGRLAAILARVAPSWGDGGAHGPSLRSSAVL